jgi:glycosyltransferase involved in cell wall biosynthesis
MSLPEVQESSTMRQIGRLAEEAQRIVDESRELLQSVRVGPAPRPELSVVIPVFDEADSLEELHRRVTAALEEIGGSWELLFVDDGSRDGSGERLEALAQRDPRVGVLRFRENFGKSAALRAGFQAARGARIVTLDADLQDDPAEIPRLLRLLDEGHDLVSGWKVRRQDPWTKRWPSRFFNLVVARATGLPLHDFNCGLKAYRREVTREIPLYGELHRFIPALARRRGFRVVELPVAHHPRRFGRSKFGTGRLLRGFFDFLTVLTITRYRERPLHLFGLAGLVSLASGGGILAWLALRWLTGQWIAGRPIFLVAILLIIVGVQVTLFGLLADLLTAAIPLKRTYALRRRLRPRV